MKVMQKVVNLSNMSGKALVSHAAGKKHMAVTAKVQMFFKPKVPKQDSKDIKKSSTSKDSHTCIIVENPPEKVVDNKCWKIQIWDNLCSKVYNVWFF